MLQQRQLALKRQKDLLARRSQPQLLGAGSVMATQNALQQKKTDWGTKFLMDSSIFDLPPAAPTPDPAKAASAAAEDDAAAAAAPDPAVAEAAQQPAAAAAATTSALRRPGTADSTSTELLTVEPPPANVARPAGAVGGPAAAGGPHAASAAAACDDDEASPVRPRCDESPVRRHFDGASSGAGAGWDLSMQADSFAAAAGAGDAQDKKGKARSFWKPWKGNKDRHAQVSSDEPTQVSDFGFGGDGIEDIQASRGRIPVDSRAVTPWAAVDASLDNSVDELLVTLPGVMEEEVVDRKQAMKKPKPQACSPLPGVIDDDDIEVL